MQNSLCYFTQVVYSFYGCCFRFSTGLEVSVHSVLIHEYYSREAKSPVHLTVDTFMRGGKMGMKAYITTQIGVPGKTTGTMFTPVQIEIASFDPEQTGGG